MIIVTVVIESGTDDDVRRSRPSELLSTLPDRCIEFLIKFQRFGRRKKCQDVRLSWNLLYRAPLPESVL